MLAYVISGNGWTLEMPWQGLLQLELEISGRVSAKTTRDVRRHVHRLVIEPKRYWVCRHDRLNNNISQQNAQADGKVAKRKNLAKDQMNIF